ncbi:MAG: fructose-bisphosphatase class I [Flavobacteriales bacterium]|jgi:fructose-1,6-bisphosphatase I|nr:fructose-bisphosphatase class I [Flavobacteriales bacterium]|tara:strand:+ start:9007 stop:9939 length:933 start_codon:yes stop_codon:yes gene_type:complete
MTLSNFLSLKKYNSNLNTILLDLAKGSTQLYEILNEKNTDVYGASGGKNIQNEEVQKLDLIANDIFIKIFQQNTAISRILSEENKDVIELNQTGEFIIAMDPLDGSSNIDVNIPVGSIFSVLENNEKGFLQKGNAQKLACYIIYGTTNIMVFTINNHVFGFTLNTKSKEYNLTHSNVKTPINGSIFSINEGNYNSMDKEIILFIKLCKELNSKGKRTHTGRFIGSLVADFHRNMLKGGIFIYPKTADRPNGQLRLIYECNPIALIAQNANGKSTNLTNPILDITPKKLHERTPFIVGSKNMVNKLLSFYN